MQADQPPPDIFDALALLADALEDRGIPYAAGGSLALGLWAQPRATEDIDLNVFVPGNSLADLESVLNAFESVGLIFNRDALLEENSVLGTMTFFWGSDLRIEVFPVSHRFQKEAAKTKVLANVQGHRIWFLSPESLAVFKLMFFRDKDMIDLETLLRDAKVDTDYVRKWAQDLYGEQSERVMTWDELVRSASES